jgi:FkbM family methyltransferase
MAYTPGRLGSAPVSDPDRALPAASQTADRGLDAAPGADIRYFPERPLRAPKRLGQYVRATKTWLIERGSRVMLGSTASIDPAGFADISLVGAGLRLAWLRSLRAIGIRKILGKSGLGYPFVCQIGDLAEHPFYIRDAYQKELELCAAWLQQERREVVVYDVGANSGFFSCQLAQMLADQPVRIYAFEAVPTTFAALASSVCRLGLQDKVFPFPAAVRDQAGPTQLTYCKRKSLCSQVTPNGLNSQIGDNLTHAVGITLNEFHLSSGALPALMKIDVEGSELSVLRGAQTLLSRADRPAIHFEYNPVTTAQSGESLEAFPALLAGYKLHYVDDLSGQKFPFGCPVSDSKLRQIDWLCNLFAVPEGEDSQSRWTSALARAQHRIGL